MANEVEFVLEGMRSAISSRNLAAKVLQEVAKHGSYGGFPDNVTCEKIGRALFRICMNSPEQDPLMEIIKGYRLAEAEKRRQELES